MRLEIEFANSDYLDRKMLQAAIDVKLEKPAAIYNYFNAGGFNTWIFDRVSKIFLMLALGGSYLFFSCFFNWRQPLEQDFKFHFSIVGIVMTFFVAIQACIHTIRLVREYDAMSYAKGIYRQLEIEDYQLSFLKWQDISYRLVERQVIENELEVQCSVTRDDNFIIGMLDKGILVGANQLSEFYIDIFKRCMRRYMDQNTPERLGTLFKYYGFISLLLIPYMLIYHISYTAIKYAVSVYKHPSSLFGMRWSVYSMYSCRHFNELPHEIEQRMRTASQIADKYNSLFPSLLRSKVAERLSFIVSEFIIILVVVLYLSSVEYVKFITTAMIAWNFIQSLIDSKVSKPNPSEITLELKKILIPSHGFESEFPTTEDHQLLSRLYTFRLWYGFNELLGVILTPVFLFYMAYNSEQMIADYIDYNIRINDKVGIIFKGTDFNNKEGEDFGTASKLMQSYMLFESSYPMSQSIQYSKMLSSRFREGE